MNKYKVINCSLHDLLANWIPDAPRCLIKNITIDSRYANVGDLFIAIPGHCTDGRKYIPQAIKKGVNAILAQTEDQTREGKIFELNNVPIIYLRLLREKLSELAGIFYRNPSRDMQLIGITGTNGKTSVAHILAQWVKLIGTISAVMGTIGNGIIDYIRPSNNTTESPIEVQQLLFRMFNQKVAFVAMEVSSHGLIQHRVDSLHFAAAIFTNLSRDHLDYHHNMEQYEEAKWKLFSDLNVDTFIINADDNVGRRWLKKLPQAIAVAVNSTLPLYEKQKLWLYAKKVIYHKHGAYIYFCSSWGEGIIHSKLIGKFNVSNLLLALTTLLSLGYPLPKLLNSASSIKPICGRMEIFRSKNSPTVLVDYAHTPDALQNVLSSARMHCRGKIWCIFGCGGNRDKGKRSLMGAIAEQYADRIIITNDNPRKESAQDIIRDIIGGFTNTNRIQIILNRTEALTKAIMQAAYEDLVLIVGKGHENYQLIGQQRLYYSDRTTVSQLLETIT